MFQSGESGEGEVVAWDTVVLCLTCEMSNAGGREEGGGRGGREGRGGQKWRKFYSF